MNQINQDQSDPARRETMIQPDQIRGDRPDKKTRKTIIDEDTPDEMESFAPQAPVARSSPGNLPSTLRFQPTTRPPTAKLYVLDDSGVDAEIVRVREDQFRIGRSGGDFVIGHDDQMSSVHVEIRRELNQGIWEWQIVDLDSTNGTFVRVTEVPLTHNLEMWIGGHLYRFRCKDPQLLETQVQAENVMEAFPTPDLSSTAQLVMIQPEGERQVFELTAPEQWIGRDPNRCRILIDDPMLSLQDAVIYVDDEGCWAIRKGKSLNGIWVRVSGAPLVGRGMQFQCGEQRFALRLD